MSTTGLIRWGTPANPDLRLQFPHAKFDRLSFATTPIELFAGDKRLAHASGFYWKSGNDVWLLTNWHCVTGNNPFTALALNPGGAPPTRLVHYPMSLIAHETEPVRFPARSRAECQLFVDGQATWLQHPSFAETRADVVALKISSNAPIEICCVNSYQTVELFHHVGADLYVVGYPLDNFEGWMPPFWKRGTHAGEPLLPMGAKPLFPIDVLSTEGMSGSPVFRRVFGPKVSPDGTEISMDNVVATEFVGVYAGRLANRELERVGIGYAWYGHLVSDVISLGINGTTC